MNDSYKMKMRILVAEGKENSQVISRTSGTTIYTATSYPGASAEEKEWRIIRTVTVMAGESAITKTDVLLDADGVVLLEAPGVDGENMELMFA